MSRMFEFEEEELGAFHKNFKVNMNHWDVSNVKDMSYMFNGKTYFNEDLSSLDVSSVTNMEEMFSHTAFNGDISKWDVSNVEDMRAMFEATPFNGDISKWDVSSVTNMGSMFYFATKFNQNISNWDVSNVKNMYGVFQCASSFNQPLGNWDVSLVETMSNLFDLSAYDRFGYSVRCSASMSTLNYNHLLNGWSKLELQPNVEFDAENIKYSSSASKSREEIISKFNWKINDGGNFSIHAKIYNSFVAKSSNFNISAMDIIPHEATGALYKWEEGDTFLGDDVNYTTNQLSVGEHNITLTVTNRQGITDKESFTINIVDTETVTPLIMNIEATFSTIQIEHNGENLFYMIDWGDGTSSNNVYKTENHHYESVGTYEVKVKIIGASPLLFFRDLPLISIEQWGNFEWSSFNSLFAYQNSFHINASDIPNLSKVTDMQHMFAHSKFDQDISNWDVSQIKTMTGLFEDALLSTLNYDKLLNRWSQLNLKKNLRLDMGKSQYSSESKDARAKLISDYNWVISDGGMVE